MTINRHMPAINDFIHRYKRLFQPSAVCYVCCMSCIQAMNNSSHKLLSWHWTVLHDRPKADLIEPDTLSHRCINEYQDKTRNKRTAFANESRNASDRWAELAQIGITTGTTNSSGLQHERTDQHERWGVKGAIVISYLPVNIPTRIWWSWLVKIIPSDAMFSSALARTDKPEQRRETSASNSGEESGESSRTLTTTPEIWQALALQCWWAKLSVG